jgi:hypothetical protein
MYASFRVQQRKKPRYFSGRLDRSEFLLFGGRKKRRAIESQSKLLRTTSTSTPTSLPRAKASKAVFYGNNGFASAQANTEGRNFSMPTRDLAGQVPRTEQIEKRKVNRLAGIIVHGDMRNAAPGECFR